MTNHCTSPHSLYFTNSDHNELDKNHISAEFILETSSSALLCTSAADHGRYFQSNTKFRKENHWRCHSLPDTGRSRENLPFQRFELRLLKFPRHRCFDKSFCIFRIVHKCNRAPSDKRRSCLHKLLL